MYFVVVWDNEGNRSAYQASTLKEAEAYACECRRLCNRTVKIAHGGDSIRHWSRTQTARRNHWAKHATAESAR